jgi:hypothetical protein
MVLRCKVRSDILQKILTGKKKVEHRQVEKIIMEDSTTGEKHHFKVLNVDKCLPDLIKIAASHYGLSYDCRVPSIMILLGSKCDGPRL